MAGRLSPDAGRATTPIAFAVEAEALSWVGTPYRHQGDRKGLGCDCIGLVRGVWQAIYGFAVEHPGPYQPDWAEGGCEEALMHGMGRHCREKAFADPQPGDLVLFRWRPHLPARHAGILVGDGGFVHAYEGAGAVVRSALVPQWRRRIAAVFTFPDIQF
ncbi:peptidase P60 [Mesorhizobium sp. Root554]|nr:peptidase P60 [Mesorhizobium sp. Root1471]KQZ35483.1 peptidase P60 [Mesorhizobium sp. Root554]